MCVRTNVPVFEYAYVYVCVHRNDFTLLYVASISIGLQYMYSLITQHELTALPFLHVILPIHVCTYLSAIECNNSEALKKVRTTYILIKLHT